MSGSFSLAGPQPPPTLSMNSTRCLTFTIMGPTVEGEQRVEVGARDVVNLVRELKKCLTPADGCDQVNFCSLEYYSHESSCFLPLVDLLQLDNNAKLRVGAYEDGCRFAGEVSKVQSNLARSYTLTIMGPTVHGEQRVEVGARDVVNLVRELKKCLTPAEGCDQVNFCSLEYYSHESSCFLPLVDLLQLDNNAKLRVGAYQDKNGVDALSTTVSWLTAKGSTLQLRPNADVTQRPSGPGVMTEEKLSKFSPRFDIQESYSLRREPGWSSNEVLSSRGGLLKFSTPLKEIKKEPVLTLDESCVVTPNVPILTSTLRPMNPPLATIEAHSVETDSFASAVDSPTSLLPSQKHADVDPEDATAVIEPHTEESALFFSRGGLLKSAIPPKEKKEEPIRTIDGSCVDCGVLAPVSATVSRFSAHASGSNLQVRSNSDIPARRTSPEVKIEQKLSAQSEFFDVQEKYSSRGEIGRSNEFEKNSLRGITHPFLPRGQTDESNESEYPLRLDTSSGGLLNLSMTPKEKKEEPIPLIQVHAGAYPYSASSTKGITLEEGTPEAALRSEDSHISRSGDPHGRTNLAVAAKQQAIVERLIEEGAIRSSTRARTPGPLKQSLHLFPTRFPIHVHKKAGARASSTNMRKQREEKLNRKESGNKVPFSTRRRLEPVLYRVPSSKTQKHVEPLRSEYTPYSPVPLKRRHPDRSLDKPLYKL